MITVKPTVGGRYLFRGAQNHKYDYPSVIISWTRVDLAIDAKTGELKASWTGGMWFSADELYGEWKVAP